MRSLGMLPVDGVRPNSWNVNAISEEDYRNLKRLIALNGPERMEPITVRRAEDGAWEIVNGEQRWKIAKELGWKAIPAVEVEVDRRTAKLLCLSYNALRGTVNMVKLAELVKVDPEMEDAAKKVYGEKAVDKLKSGAKGLTEEAKRELEESVRKGGIVTPTVIEAIAQAPSHEQRDIARVTLHGRGAVEDQVWSEVQRRVQKTTEEEEPMEEPMKPEEAVKVGVGVEVKPKAVEAVRTYRTAAYVEIEEPGVYLVYYNDEERVIGVRRYNIDMETYSNVTAHESYYKFEFKCRKCGTAYVGSLEMPDGKLEIRER